MTSLRPAVGSAWLPFLVGIAVFFTWDRNVGIILVCWGFLRWMLKGRSEKEGCH